MMKRIAHFGAVAMLLLALPLAVPGSALAHAELVSTDPAADASVAAPTALSIAFSEPIEVAFAKVVVKGADGKEVATGPVALDPADNKKLVVPLTAAPAAGTVTVDWEVVSTDGHKTNGSYTFTVN